MTQYITEEALIPLLAALLAVVAAVAGAIAGSRASLRVTRAVKRQSERPLPEGGYPDASIVVYTHGNSSGLAELLPALLAQDYPADFEIIVVNDGRDDATETLVNNLSGGKRRVYHTFTPHDTRNLSRKKLALTLGIKAARHDAIVHVTSETRPGSTLWLREMTCPLINPETAIVLGCALPANDNGPGARHRDHDSLVESADYLAAAATGHAYRGNGDNLAYRRSLFFDMKGFSNSLNLHYGDDDIFVHDATTPDNTAIAVAPDARVTTVTDDPAATYRYTKLRHAFTGNFTGNSRRMTNGIVAVLPWMWVACALTAVATAPLNPVVAGCILLSGVLLWIPLMRNWHLAAKALGSRKFLFSVPGYLLSQPLRNLGYLLKSKKIHDTQYAWHST